MGTRAHDLVGPKASALGIDGHLAAWRGKRLSLQNHAAAAGAGFRAAGAAVRTFKAVKEAAKQEKEEVGDGAAPAGSDAMSGLTPKQLKATQAST